MLDETLALSNAEKAGESLEERVLASFEAAPRKASAGARFALRRLIPAGALAGLTAVGFAAGAASAGTVADSELAALYYAEATLAVAAEEDALWAQE